MNVPGLEAYVGIVTSVVQSKKGDLFVSSGSFGVILKVEFNKRTGASLVTLVAGTGTDGKGGDDILATGSALKYPIGLSLVEDDDGEVTAIIFADSNNHRIRKVDMKSQKITTIVGTGSGGETGDGGPAKDATLYRPYHAYHDKVTGDIFIADAGNNKIRRVFAGNRTITTVVGKKCTNDEGLGDGGKAVVACLNFPYFFTMNTAGEWFITDWGNNRIRRVLHNGTIDTVIGGG